jgi:dTDP-4-dehydrorhamnose 3,5-epimerase
LRVSRGIASLGSSVNIILGQTAIHGCYVIGLPAHADDRGTFVKVFQSDAFRAHGLETNFPEEFWSVSRRHVLRGLHFQVPPHEHVKLVCCVAGEVFDALVDLRKGSPTYGRSFTITLTGDTPTMIYVPIGVAHGFYAMSDQAIVLYKVSTIHSPAHDRGVLWESVGIPWPDGPRLLSPRDRSLPRLSEYESPFFAEPADA